jgi:hypothetical protein
MKKLYFLFLLLMLASSAFSQFTKTDAEAFITNHPLANCKRIKILSSVGIESWVNDIADIATHNIGITAKTGGLNVVCTPAEAAKYNVRNFDCFIPYSRVAEIKISDGDFVIIVD